jgi:hypothetical protein
MPRPTKFERPVEYETVEMREVVLGFPSGAATSILYPEDTIEYPGDEDEWHRRITCHRLSTVVEVYLPHLEFLSVRTFQGQRVKVEAGAAAAPSPNSGNTPPV